MARFSVGDEVVIVGNTNKDKHNIGWCTGMYDMIGRAYVVRDVYDIGTHGCYCRLKGDEHRFAFDEDWLEAVGYEKISAELESFILGFQK